MKAKLSIALSVIATLVVLTFVPLSKPVLAQDKGGQGNAQPSGQGRGRGRRARDPWTARRGAAFTDRSVHLKELLQGPSGLDG